MRHFYTIFSGVILLIFGSCQNDDTLIQKTTDQSSLQFQYLHELLPDGAHNLSETTVKISNTNSRSIKEVCDTGVLRSFDQSDSNFFLMDPNSSVLWPGNLIGVKTIEEGRPSSLPIDGANRNPIEVRVNVLSGTSAPTFSNIENPTPGKVQHDLNQIMNEYYDSGARFPASFDISIEKIYNQSQLQVALKAGYSGPSVNVSGNLGVHFNQEKTRFAVTLRQRFFTVSVAPKENFIGPFGWLKGNASSDQLDAHITNFMEVPIQEMNPAGYVESVTYGRLYTMIYESDANSLEVEAALNFAYKGIGIEAGAGIEVDSKKIIQNSKVIVRQLGGDAESGIKSSLSAMSNDVDAIIDFLTKGANVSRENPGYPISYKVNYVDGNRVFNTISNIEYIEKNCKLFRIDKIRIDPTHVALSSASDHGTSGAELFGRLYVEKYDVTQGKWYLASKKIRWGYGIDHMIRDFYPFSGKKEYGQGKVIDFSIKAGSGERFRVVSEVGECDSSCNPYADTAKEGRREIVYEYDVNLKKWVDINRHNPYVRDYFVGKSLHEKTWNGAFSKVEGANFVADYDSYIIE